MSGTTHGFTGQRWDEETGLYFFKNRHYSPKLGRFLEPDPIGLGDGLNMFTYVENNPLNMVDVYGLAATPSPSVPYGGGGVPGDPTWTDPTKSGPNGEPPKEGTTPDPFVDQLFVDLILWAKGAVDLVKLASGGIISAAIARNILKRKDDVMHTIDIGDLLQFIVRPENIQKVDGKYIQYGLPGILRYTSKGQIKEVSGTFEVGYFEGEIVHYFFRKDR